MVRMILLNTATQYKDWFCKTINCSDYSAHELNEIYEFYSNHKNYVVLHDWN